MPEMNIDEANFLPSFTLPNGISWEEAMREALKEAAKAEALDEVPVGAVLLNEHGEIIGRGHNCPISTCNAVAHAEIMAISNACKKLNNYRLINSYLVVTLEPCLMCVGAMIHARLKGVVFGASDYKTGAVKSQIQALDLPFHNHKLLWVDGVLQEECANILSSFFQKKRQKTCPPKVNS